MIYQWSDYFIVPKACLAWIPDLELEVTRWVIPAPVHGTILPLLDAVIVRALDKIELTVDKKT